MDNLDIFICTHKDCNTIVNHPAYKLLYMGGHDDIALLNNRHELFFDHTGDSISHLNKFYCELTGIYWVWKNYDVKDYVGFCHYRRYFQFLNDIPDISKEDCDIILLRPLFIDKTLYEHYDMYHNIKDLDLVIDIMKEMYGIPDDICNTLSNTNLFYARNMFIMSKEMFNEYCEFMFNILFEFQKRCNIYTMNDVYKIIENDPVYIKPAYHGKDFNWHLQHQARMGGFLAERFMNIYSVWKNLKIKTYNCIQTEW